MPIFMDVHKVPFAEEHLKELCQAPRDEFGVSHVNLLYNKEANVCFCLLVNEEPLNSTPHDSRRARGFLITRLRGALSMEVLQVE